MISKVWAMMMYLLVGMISILMWKMEMMNLLLLLEFFFLCLLLILFVLSSDFYFSMVLVAFSSCEAVISLSFLMFFMGEFKSYLLASVAEFTRKF